MGEAGPASRSRFATSRIMRMPHVIAHRIVIQPTGGNLEVHENSLGNV